MHGFILGIHGLFHIPFAVRIIVALPRTRYPLAGRLAYQFSATEWAFERDFIHRLIRSEPTCPRYSKENSSAKWTRWGSEKEVDPTDGLSYGIGRGRSRRNFELGV